MALKEGERKRICKFMSDAHKLEKKYTIAQVLWLYSWSENSLLCLACTASMLSLRVDRSSAH